MYYIWVGSGFGVLCVMAFIYGIFETATKGSITSILILVISFLLFIGVIAFIIWKRKAALKFQKEEQLRKDRELDLRNEQMHLEHQVRMAQIQNQSNSMTSYYGNRPGQPIVVLNVPTDDVSQKYTNSTFQNSENPPQYSTKY